MDFTKTIKGFAAALACAAPLAGLAQEDPEAVYDKVHKAVIAEKWAEVTKLSTERLNKEVEAQPRNKRQLTQKTLPKLFPATYTVVEKRTSPDGQVFEMRATGTSAPLGKPETYYGVMKLAKDGSSWKVDDYDWLSKPPANFSLAAQTKPAAKSGKPAAAKPAAEAKPADAAKADAAAKPGTVELPPDEETEVKMSEEEIAKALAEEQALARKKAAEDAAFERQRQREARLALCVIKPVMSDEEIELCRLAFRD